MFARSIALVVAASLVVVAFFVGPIDMAGAQTDKQPPYWVSLAKDEARMRAGPSTAYPARWIYHRRNLPLKVVETYPNWRKVEDSEGTVGWMHVRLLKDQPTAIVKNGKLADMRDGPASDARLLYRVEPGVVGKLSGCARGWCVFDAQGHDGYVEAASLWGATTGN